MMPNEKDKELVEDIGKAVAGAVVEESASLKDKMDDLRNRVPDFAKPWVDEFGPVFLKLAKKDGGKALKAFIYRVSVGDVEAAYQDLVDEMSKAQQEDAMDSVIAEWRDHANDQAEKLEARNAALTAMVKILIPIAVAALGF